MQKLKKEYFLSRDEVHKVENAITDEERAQALKHAARNIQAQNRTFGGAHRYCHINKCIKPDRSHYCSGMNSLEIISISGHDFGDADWLQ